MADEQKNNEQPETLQVKKSMLIGMAVLLICVCASVGYILWRSAQSTTETEDVSVIGVLDLQQVAKAHPDYSRLGELEQEIAQLEYSLSVQPPIKVEVPEPKQDEELFEEAAKQKQRLDAIERHSQLMDELNELAEKKREEVRPQYEAERNAISEPYLNEMLNLRLKIDSADVLGLTEEQVQEMLARIEEIQAERSAVLEKINAEQEERFRQLMADAAAAPMAELKELEASYQQQMQQDELEIQMKAQERNAREMEQALTPIQQKISNAKKTALLEAKKIQLQQLQNKIYSDISSLATKLAIIHKLTLILSSPADNLRGIDYSSTKAGQWKPELSPVLGINTVDLTEEMLKEMETLN